MLSMGFESRIPDELRRSNAQQVKQTQVSNRMAFARVLENGLASGKESAKNNPAAGKQVIDAAIAQGLAKSKYSGPARKKGEVSDGETAEVLTFENPRLEAQAQMQARNPLMKVFQETEEMAERGRLMNVVYLMIQHKSMQFDREYGLVSTVMKDHGDGFRKVLKNIAG